MSMKKRIITIGWVLLGLMLASILAIAIIGVLEGDGARSLKLVRGGRGGTVFPVALLPVFLAAIAIGFFWIWRRFFSSKKINNKGDTENQGGAK